MIKKINSWGTQFLVRARMARTSAMLAIMALALTLTAPSANASDSTLISGVKDSAYALWSMWKPTILGLMILMIMVGLFLSFGKKAPKR